MAGYAVVGFSMGLVTACGCVHEGLKLVCVVMCVCVCVLKMDVNVCCGWMVLCMHVPARVMVILLIWRYLIKIVTHVANNRTMG